MSIITSLLDVDLYKFTMQQSVLHHFPSTEVRYKFICRDKTIDFRPVFDRIKVEILSLSELEFTGVDLKYLSSISFFKPDFISFLRRFKLYPDDQVSISCSGPDLNIEIKGF